MTGPPSKRHARRCRKLARRLIPILRAVAREHGYALGVHGSLARDIDLIACPWTSEAADAKKLAEGIQAAAAAHNGGIAFHKPGEDKEYHRTGSPGAKAHGRRVWTFHLGGGPYLDLSVMPRVCDCLGRLCELVKKNETQGP